MKTQTKKRCVEKLYKVQNSSKILADINDDELNYLNSFVYLDSDVTSVIGAKSLSSNDRFSGREIKNLVGLDSLNNISQLNDFIKKANRILPLDGLFACKFSPKEIRKKTIQQAYNNHLLFYPVYFSDFLWHRVCPKLKFTRPIYDRINGGKKRVFALAEALGRVAAGGFEIVDYRKFGKEIFFIAKKVGDPSFDASKSEGILFTMRRIGKDGKMKDFYKLRTMHLYAEHLQNFVYKKNGLENGDKFNDDFRVTTVGKFLRKYWLDEIPMVFNLLKGDLKLVGVRPLSNQKFNLYTKRLQEYRTKFKPGLLPPYYADLPESLEETMDSEIKYLESYEKHPFRTDFKYFFKVLYNIFVKKARSK